MLLMTGVTSASNREMLIHTLRRYYSTLATLGDKSRSSTSMSITIKSSNSARGISNSSGSEEHLTGVGQIRQRTSCKHRTQSGS